MPWNKDGSRKESTLYKKSSFQLRSGNTTAFKAMGSSPAKQEKDKPTGWEGIASEISEETTTQYVGNVIATDATKLSSDDFMKKHGITIMEYKTEQGSK